MIHWAWLIFAFFAGALAGMFTLGLVSVNCKNQTGAGND